MTSDLYETTRTPPPPAASPELPRLGLGGGLRFLWTQLSSMRTALVLLFALALAAIPGSLIPQRKVSPVRVSDFLTEHPTLGPLYDRVGLFNVYTSPWFSAVYLLLFVSLIGCIIPRVAVYLRAVRARPPRTPRNLDRLPAYAEAPLAGSASSEDVEGVLDRAAALLRQQRYRVDRHADSVSAERGYLREAGNLVFHISLLFVLLGAGLNGLYGFSGTSVVVEGRGFSNNLTQYDDLSRGPWFDAEDLVPFNVAVKDFQVQFETGAVQRGAARLFRADVEVTDEPGATPVPRVIEVNHPLTIHGTTVHLIGHGYAPEVTVKDGDGNVAFSGPVVFLPQDGNFKSAGVVKVPDARPERLAFEGFFMPTGTIGAMGPQSLFPDAIDPEMFLNVWYGPPKIETGQSENVYSLDRTGLTQLKDPKTGDFVRFPLKPGLTATLPDGKGSITMTGWTRWVKLQVGDAPGVGISIAAIGFAVLGLCLSLFIRPRRIWVRVAPAGSGVTSGTGGISGTRESGGPEAIGGVGSRVVQVGGLDRADARAGLNEDVAELAVALTTPAESAPAGATKDEV